MNLRTLLHTYIVSGILVMSACNGNKPSSPSSATPDNSKPPSTATAPAGSAESSASAQSAPHPVAIPAPPPPPPPPKPVVVPTGTVLAVRLEQAVGSKSSQSGNRFEATVSQAVVMDGNPVIPAGSSASGTVTEAHPAGRFKGGATLNLSLETLNRITREVAWNV